MGSLVFNDDGSKERLLYIRMKQVSEGLPSEKQKKAAIKMELRALVKLRCVLLHEPIDNAIDVIYKELWGQP
jgi:hypothetical protein